jgi:hypothetical protein
MIMVELGWDPEVDTPATIAVLGGGPSGIEAALYARFLGYSVELYDRHKVGDSLLLWGDRSMCFPWRELASTLGLAAMEAHDHPLPDLNRIPTYREYVDTYLLPIARNDLLYSTIHVQTPVLSISRLGCDECDTISLDRHAEQEFRLLLSSSQRGQFSQVVDIVLDCSGRQSVSRGLATGGGVPIGWSELGARVHQGRRRILDRERNEFSGKRVLLVGNDAAAAANALELFELTKSNQTQLFWLILKRIEPGTQLLDCIHTGCPLSVEEQAQAEKVFREADDISVVPLSGWGIEALKEADSQLLVTLQTTEDKTVDLCVDRVIDCSRPIAQPSYAHNLQLNAHPASAIITHEPHFYRVGSRATTDPADAASFYSMIRRQIRELFGLIGGRAELDLYQTVKPQSLPAD